MKRAAAVVLLVLALAGCGSPPTALETCVQRVLELGEAQGIDSTPELVERVTATCERDQQRDPEGFQQTWG